MNQYKYERHPKTGALGVWMEGEFVPVLAGGALLGTFVDSRTVAAPTGAASGSFAHGIVGLVPDAVVVDFATTSASIASPGPLCATFDGTNVTYSNPGNSTTPVPTILTERLQSIIR